MSYTEMPLNENEDYDLENFSDEQLTEYYFDHPEAMTDEMMFGWI